MPARTKPAPHMESLINQRCQEGFEEGGVTGRGVGFEEEGVEGM